VNRRYLIVEEAVYQGNKDSLQRIIHQYFVTP